MTDLTGRQQALDEAIAKWRARAEYLHGESIKCRGTYYAVSFEAAWFEAARAADDFSALRDAVAVPATPPPLSYDCGAFHDQLLHQPNCSTYVAVANPAPAVASPSPWMVERDSVLFHDGFRRVWRVKPPDNHDDPLVIELVVAADPAGRA